MKTFIKAFGLAVVLGFPLMAGQVRAQDDQNSTDTPSQNGDATAPPSDEVNIAPNDNSGAPQYGDGSVSFQTFYDQLANQGTWIQSDKYGYVWQPTESNPNWRPYTYGHWVNTDAGMTWVSDESFGWATYHYGRWVNLDGDGWVWVPGYTWAPAWVSWREGDDDVGWAPLPPDSDVGIDYYDNSFDLGFGDFFGFHIGDDCDVAYGIGPGCYNFCPIAYIGDRDAWRHFRNHDDNFGFIGHTRNVTNINFRRDGAGRFGRVHAEGPSVAALNARSRTPIGTARLSSATRLTGAGLHGNSLAVYAPRVDPATVKTARPGSVDGRLTNATVNRGTDINRPLAVNSHVRTAGATAEQIHAATLAQGNVSANAKIATTHTRISRSLNQPLTAMHTATRSGAANTSFGPNGRLSTAVNAPTRVATPSVSTESRYTGAPVRQQTISSREESRFTGEPVTRGGAISSPGASRYTGEAFGSQGFTRSNVTPTYHSAPAYSSGGSYYNPSSVYHPQASAPVYHPSAPIYQPHVSAPAFQSSAPAYHPQASFHSFAPAPQRHFSGGGFGGGGYHAAPAAPAAHFSGGGGAVHASVGGGQPGGRH